MSDTPDADTAMAAEFDTVADWTADAAIALGADHYVAAGCRGSGSPAALDWLLDRLDPPAGAALLDSGAGVGGPAAYAARQRGVRPLLVEPEHGACRAARRLFQLPAVQGAAGALPAATGTWDAAWSLGVLSTVTDQLGLLRELRRVTRPDAPIGLLVYVARSEDLPGQPDGNHFPTPGRLRELVAAAGLSVAAQTGMGQLPAPSRAWQRRTEAVEAELDRRHGDSPAWHTAQEQSAAIGRLLRDGRLSGELLVLRRA